MSVKPFGMLGASRHIAAPSVTHKCQTNKVEIWLSVCVSVFADVLCAGFTDQSDFPVSFSVCPCSHDVNTAPDWQWREGQSEWARQTGASGACQSVSQSDGQTDSAAEASAEGRDRMNPPGRGRNTLWSVWTKLQLIPWMSPTDTLYNNVTCSTFTTLCWVCFSPKLAISNNYGLLRIYMIIHWC